MNELLEMSKEKLEERTKELLQIDQVDLILKYLYQEQRINKAIEYIENNLLYEEIYDYDLEDIQELKSVSDEKATNELLDILKGGNNE